MKSTNLPTVPHKKLTLPRERTRLKKPGALPNLQHTFARTVMQELQRFGRQCGVRAVWIVKRCMSGSDAFSREVKGMPLTTFFRPQPLKRVCPHCTAIKYQPICTYCKQEGGEVPSMREQLKEEYQSGLDSPEPEGEDDGE